LIWYLVKLTPVTACQVNVGVAVVRTGPGDWALLGDSAIPGPTTVGATRPPGVWKLK